MNLIVLLFFVFALFQTSKAIHSEMKGFIPRSCLDYLDYLGAGMAQWWEHSPPTNVARDRFSDPTLYVGWVCCSRGFSPGTPVFPSPQKPTFPISNSIRIFQWTNSHYLWRCHLNSHLILIFFFIIYDMASFKATSTGFLIATTNDAWLTAISPLN